MLIEKIHFIFDHLQYLQSHDCKYSLHLNIPKNNIKNSNHTHSQNQNHNQNQNQDQDHVSAPPNNHTLVPAPPDSQDLNVFEHIIRVIAVPPLFFCGFYTVVNHVVIIEYFGKCYDTKKEGLRFNPPFAMEHKTVLSLSGSAHSM
jgi:hypothetical protein